MTVNITKGDIFQSDAPVLVNPVNCVGVSGKGLAKEFAKRYPTGQMFYMDECRVKRLRPGGLYLFKPLLGFFPDLDGEKAIAYLPTKKHWKDKKSDPEAIVDSLVALRYELWKERVLHVAIPALGCGLGGLDFVILSMSVELTFEPYPEIQVDLYEPNDENNS